MSWVRRLLARDAGYSALRRGARAAIVTPVAFGLCHLLLQSTTMATFAAFGSIATLLFVDFGGPIRDRMTAQIALILTQALLICVGTFASRALWIAVPAAFLVSFAVLFSGIVSSVVASATLTLLLAFVLPVTLPGSTIDTLPLRLAGWLLAGALSTVAIGLLWPAPARDPLRASTARVCALLSRRMHADVEWSLGGRTPELRAEREHRVADADQAVASLRTAFYGAPYRPTGVTSSARAVVRLVDEIGWLNAILNRMPPDALTRPPNQPMCAVKLAAADLLQHGSDLLDAPVGDPRELEEPLRRVRDARDAMERAVISALPHRSPAGGERSGDDPRLTEFVTSLEPSFRAQEMSFAVSAIATNVEASTAARRRPWFEQLLGHEAGSQGSALSSAWERLASHLRLQSVWLHNSLRGAAAISLAVLVAGVFGAQHSFWVVFGTLAVLRSSALNTGQNAVRAVLGTAAGFAIGAALVVLTGTHTTAYWILLPIAILVAGMAPATISFTAGQAAFTVVLVVLYNLIAPVGWEVGLIRVEDVALGAAVSLVVGVIFWPRGAGSELGRALSDALTDSAHYLRRAVDFGVNRCDRQGALVPAPDEQQRQASASARRLDDAFREFLTERGHKHLPLSEVTTLLTTVAALRLTGDAVVDLWARDDGRPAGDRTAARAEIEVAGNEVTGWYEATAHALDSGTPGAVPEETVHDAASNQRLVETVRTDLAGEDGQGTATAVRMIWTADHLDAARRLEGMACGPARSAAAQIGRRRRAA